MQKGRLKSWIDERGFGFIQPDDGSEDLFFHVSALQAANRRPIVGDVVLFQVIDDGNGRKKADVVSIEGVESVFAGRDVPKHHHRPLRKAPPKYSFPEPTYHRPRKSTSQSVAAVLTVAVVLVAVITFVKFDKPHALAGLTISSEMAELPVASEPAAESNFRCEGKTHCTQMTSCAEATFYLNNCPDSVTDGDGDGQPCEDQWCGH